MRHVAFLTQDSVPADDRWLARLLAGFGLAADVDAEFGPYRPRPDASVMVARELTEWFRSFSPDGVAAVWTVWRRASGGSSRDVLLGPRGFFTDANGCVAGEAWQSVPFRQVAYAEDHVLAHDMLRAGYAKAYLPDAAVIHSHEYSGRRWLKRSFDEGRALHAGVRLRRAARCPHDAAELVGAGRRRLALGAREHGPRRRGRRRASWPRSRCSRGR